MKAHLLGIPGCGIKCCTAIELPDRKELEKEQSIGEANVAAKSKKSKTDDPLPFLRKSSRKFPFETSSRGELAKRKATAVGPMDNIFQKEKREELDLTIAFFSTRTSYPIMLHGHLYLLRCVELLVMGLLWKSRQIGRFRS